MIIHLQSKKQKVEAALTTLRGAYQTQLYIISVIYSISTFCGAVLVSQARLKQFLVLLSAAVISIYCIQE